MRKLANHVTLFWSHDYTGFLVKYTAPDQNYFNSPRTGPTLIQSKFWVK